MGQLQSGAASNAPRVASPDKYTATKSNAFKQTAFDNRPWPAGKSERSLFSLTGHGNLTSRLSGRLRSPLLDHRLVHASIHCHDLFIDITQKKKVVPKPPASSEPPKTTPRSEGGPANTLDNTKHEPSRAEHGVEVMAYCMCSKAEAHVNFCRRDLKNHHGAELT